MKAVVYEKYGAPDVLELAEVPKPVPAKDEVLVKVHATTVTAGDWRMRRAKPFAARLYNGLLRPRRVTVLGFDLAGVVEEAGAAVSRFKVGDPVFAWCGFRFGGYAEYRCFRESDKIEIKPSNISFEEAAAVPTGGITALGFVKKANLRAGQRILIYGASGSVGTFAVQLAKYEGAYVTGVCSTANLDLVRSLGADHVVDYTKEDLSAGGGEYDVVFDAVGKLPGAQGKKLLEKNGRYLSVFGSPAKVPGDLGILKQLIEDGKLRVVIDRTYTLDQIREAHRYVEGGHKRGNVVVQMD